MSQNRFHPASLAALCLALLMTLAFSPRAMAADPKPKLMVLVVVDQLRGDMPEKYYDRFGPGGFKLLMDRGARYTNAHYRHGNTITAVGHATIATGGGSATHGMAGNDWYEDNGSRLVYCVEDDNYIILGRKPKKNVGVSPRNLTSSTFSDELILSNGGQSRVFGVSGKDRGAIIPAGHFGKAFWYSSTNGQFITSTYYYSDYPAWAAEWNAKKPAERYRGKKWELLKDRETYWRKDMDDRPYERGSKKLGGTFPHPLDGGKPEDLYSTIRSTPFVDVLTVEFAKTILDNEKLGQGAATDILTISLSCTDGIGHTFGPDSLEAEDNMLRLDALLADLFNHIDKRVGLNQTMIVLSSDHGMDSCPEHRQHFVTDAEKRAVKIDWAKVAADEAKEKAAKEKLDKEKEAREKARKEGKPIPEPAPDKIEEKDKKEADKRPEEKPASDDKKADDKKPDDKNAKPAPKPYVPTDAHKLAGRIGRSVKDEANALLKKRYRTEDEFINNFGFPSLYIKQDVVKAHNLTMEEVERALAEDLLKTPGVMATFTRTDFISGRAPNTELGRKMYRAFHPTRSGNVLVVFKPFWLASPFPTNPKDEYGAASHGSPHSYDTHVPVMFFGPGIRPGSHIRKVGPEDIAPTVSHLLGTVAPSASDGEVLGEVLAPKEAAHGDHAKQ